MQKLQETPKIPQTVVIRSFLSNLLMVSIGILLIYWSYCLIKARMTTVISKDAVINGVLIDLKTPSEGIITQFSSNTGESTTQDQILMVLKNERVSKLKIQEIISRLNEYKTRLKRAQGKLAQDMSLLKIVTADQENYRSLRVQETQQSIAQINANLQAARARLELAKVKYKRGAYLTNEGALAKADLDEARLEKQESIAQVSQLEAQLKKFSVEEKAAYLDLSLNRSFSNFDPKIRLQQLRLDIADQRLAIQTLQQSVKDAELELKEAKIDHARLQSIVVKAPVAGIIWRLDARKGQYVGNGDSLGKVLDCQRRWIDIYLEERALESIHPNTPATVELYGAPSEVLQGQVSLVRSGIGRLAPGEEIAVPLIPNLPRQSQVRIDLPKTKKGDSNLFCYVGYTAKVTFKVK
ncbi:HlyD family secretion protein [Kalymmatonema gypsitolerans NIES-4073]|nr:HlyD family secretion protein [Scytonema sp. NIES-4073]